MPNWHEDNATRSGKRDARTTAGLGSRMVQCSGTAVLECATADTCRVLIWNSPAFRVEGELIDDYFSSL